MNQTLIHMHEGEAVYYDAGTPCPGCIEPAPAPASQDLATGVSHAFQFGVMIGQMRAAGIPENEIRDMTEFALSMCRNVP